MPAIHRVSQYSGLNYHEVLDLDCDIYLLMLKNSIVSELEKTEEGREYLEKCNRLQQTEPDIQALREFKQGR